MSDDEKSKDANASSNTPALTTGSSDASTVTFVKLRPKEGLLVIKMYTPYKTFFEGDARSISALNDTGEFDVLAGHHNFITMLKPCKVVIQLSDNTSKKIPIARGLMHVREDKVMVFLDV